MKSKIVRVKINGYLDRENMVKSLVNSGYKVWVEEDNSKLLNSNYYVCFDLRNVRDAKHNNNDR